MGFKKLTILFGVLCVSFSAVFVRYADASSLTLVFYRMGIAWLLLTPAVAYRCRGEFGQLTGKTLLLCTISGIFLGLHFLAYFESLRYTSIGSSVVLANTEVFFVAFGGRLLLGERVPRAGWAGIGLAFVGSVLIAAGDWSGGPNVVLGDLLALSSAAAMSVYTMAGRVVRRRHSTVFYTFFVYGMAALTVLAAGALVKANVTSCSGKDLLLCLLLAVVCTLLGHSLYSWGLRYVNAAYVSTVKLLEPVLAALQGWLLFRESPGAAAIAGGFLIMGGVWWYSRLGRSEERLESHCV